MGRRGNMALKPILVRHMRAFPYEKGLTVRELFNWTKRGAKIAPPRINGQYMDRDSKEANRFPAMPFISLAGQEGFEPPTPGFGVRCSNR